MQAVVTQNCVLVIIYKDTAMFISIFSKSVLIAERSNKGGQQVWKMMIYWFEA